MAYRRPAFPLTWKFFWRIQFDMWLSMAVGIVLLGIAAGLSKIDSHWEYFPAAVLTAWSLLCVVLAAQRSRYLMPLLVYSTFVAYIAPLLFSILLRASHCHWSHSMYTPWLPLVAVYAVSRCLRARPRQPNVRCANYTHPVWDRCIAPAVVNLGPVFLMVNTILCAVMGIALLVSSDEMLQLSFALPGLVPMLLNLLACTIATAPIPE